MNDHTPFRVGRVRLHVQLRFVVRWKVRSQQDTIGSIRFVELRTRIQGGRRNPYGEIGEDKSGGSPNLMPLEFDHGGRK